jgi:hypothetical protein
MLAEILANFVILSIGGAITVIVVVVLLHFFAD